ncbi:hypothetical protein DPX16_16470 [Anabarilius grahami]|uniref:Uncharacterized protein n=1 Tax=Anabarilius grahami TaxID=495550 RepID=A0A3N0XXN0_ANAGA|nr:hypothetical protein DPX16_16470 [Anabarilius grahami]
MVDWDERKYKYREHADKHHVPPLGRTSQTQKFSRDTRNLDAVETRDIWGGNQWAALKGCQGKQGNNKSTLQIIDLPLPWPSKEKKRVAVQRECGEAQGRRQPPLS